LEKPVFPLPLASPKPVELLSEGRRLRQHFGERSEALTNLLLPFLSFLGRLFVGWLRKFEASQVRAKMVVPGFLSPGIRPAFAVNSAKPSGKRSGELGDKLVPREGNIAAAGQAFGVRDEGIGYAGAVAVTTNGKAGRADRFGHQLVHSQGAIIISYASNVILELLDGLDFVWGGFPGFLLLALEFDEELAVEPCPRGRVWLAI
jgi:hypothetical protein